jgi:hypothetical protein
MQRCCKYWMIGTALAAVLAVTCAPREAIAAEAGTNPYLQGYKDFLSGVLPPKPGVYVRNDTVYYNGDIGKTVLGGQVEVSLKQWLVADIVAPTVVTSYHLLGGVYAYGVAFPLIYANVNAGVSTSRASLSGADNAFNIGNIILTPGVLAWHEGNFFWNLAFSVVAPTCHYDKDVLADTGVHYWTFLPQFSISYFVPQSGWDVSAAFNYAINTKNNATDYQTGDIFDLDWAVGKQLTPHWKIGAVGYLVEQVTGDSGSGAVLGANEMSVWGIGPAAAYSFELAGMPVTALAKWTHQVAATRTFSGDNVTVALEFKL